jgi:hypothetical protein
MVNSKRAATYHPLDGPPRQWRLRWYWHAHVYVSHGMPRSSALALAHTMRDLGVPVVMLPDVEERRPL